MQHSSRVCIAATGLSLFLLALLTCGGARAEEADYYVAPGGKDSWDGRLPESDGTGGGPTHQTFGIQVDDGSGEILFEKNIVYNVPDACWKQFGKQHTVQNNIFAFADGYEIIRRRDEGSLVFQRNIVLSDDGQILGDSWKKQNYKFDHNLYWDSSDQARDFGGMSFKEWQAQGHDIHSLFADPRFADPRKGDFRLPPDSPAFKVGFEPIDLGKVGPRHGGQ